MDKQLVINLINKWEELLKITKQLAIEKAESLELGMDGRIKRALGSPVIFCIDGYRQQIAIVKAMSSQLPELCSLISSKPDILDGFRWRRGDYIDLYFSHFDVVIYKLKEYMLKIEQQDKI